MSALICAYCEEKINPYNQSYTWMMVNGNVEPVHVSDHWNTKSCDYQMLNKIKLEKEHEQYL